MKLRDLAAFLAFERRDGEDDRFPQHRPDWRALRAERDAAVLSGKWPPQASLGDEPDPTMERFVRLHVPPYY